MKVLILTASTGQGHNQAAESLRQTYSSKNYEVTTFDFISNEQRLENFLIVEAYEFLAKNLPNLYGRLYKLTDKKLSNKSITLLLKRIKNNVYNKILEETPDIIIGTHPFAVKIISHLKKKNKIDIPFISVVTDFKAHYTYVNPSVDAYITASEYTKETLCKYKIPEKKIFPIGIPIREDFFKPNKVSKHEKFTILLMGGSMGLNAIEDVLKELMYNPNEIRIVVICGNNEILRQNLLNKYTEVIENKTVEILGFTKNISYFMEEAHVLITKPGGLTVSEAIAKKLPLIIPFAIPGQEKENLDFLVKSGIAIGLNNLSELNPTINKLIINPLLIDQMVHSLEKLAKNFSVEKILSLSDSLTKKSYA